MRSWELKGELDVEPEIEGVLGADPGIKGIFGGDLEIAGVLVGKYGRTAVGSGAFPLWQSKSRARGPAIAMQSQQRPRFDGYDISHNVYYVLARLARATVARARPALQAPPSYGRPNTVLSAANLGQLARQLVAIDALSYVQSQ